MRPDLVLFFLRLVIEALAYRAKRALLGLAIVALLPAVPVASAAPTPTGLPDCTETVASRVHPYYGPGLVVRCSDGLAFAVRTNRGGWAIVYGAFPDLDWTMPAWADQILTEAAATR
jgi:hypothetical protein